jgi:hypothetical protein
METISPQQLRHFFAATGDELLKLRLLVDVDDDGEFPQSEAARALLAIRQGTRRRDPITEQWRQAQQKTPAPNILQRLRRGVSRRVPPQ